MSSGDNGQDAKSWADEQVPLDIRKQLLEEEMRRLAAKRAKRPAAAEPATDSESRPSGPAKG